MDVNKSEKIIATCRDTMLTALEKIGGQSLICSWTRHDGSTVKLSLTIRESNQNTVADCIRDMNDEEMARRLVPNVLDVLQMVDRARTMSGTGWSCRRAFFGTEEVETWIKPILSSSLPHWNP